MLDAGEQVIHSDWTHVQQEISHCVPQPP